MVNVVRNSKLEYENIIMKWIMLVIFKEGWDNGLVLVSYEFFLRE